MDFSDEDLYKECPKCKVKYSELDFDLQICSNCKWIVDENKYINED